MDILLKREKIVVEVKTKNKTTYRRPTEASATDNNTDLRAES